MLAKTRKELQHRVGQWPYFNRNLRIYEGTKTYLLKPMQRFHWAESQAMVDAGEIIAETMAAEGACRLRVKSQRIDPEKVEAYRSTFIKHVHLLVVRAHCRLDHSSLHTLHEPAITGLLCQQIEFILDDPASPR